MAYDVQFCDSLGKTMMGSDGVTYVDKRKNTFNCLQDIANHRERFSTMPHKYEQMTHCIFRGKIHKVPTVRNENV